MITRCYNEPIQ